MIPLKGFLHHANWLNQPISMVHVSDNSIEVVSTPESDFWQNTHYQFTRDNGNFYFQGVEGDFTVQVKLTGSYSELYDQAGIMVRLNKENWIKAGVEFVSGSKVVRDGGQQASVVVTRGGFSDWSVVPLAESPPSVWIRIKRVREAFHVYYSLDGADFKVLRLAFLTTEPVLKVGLMVASPTGQGFKTTFEDFKLILSNEGEE